MLFILLFFFRSLSPNSSSPHSHPSALLLFLIVQLLLSPKLNIQVISMSKTKSSTVPKRNMMCKKCSITQINMVPFWVKALVFGPCLKGRIVAKSRSHTNRATTVVKISLDLSLRERKERWSTWSHQIWPKLTREWRNFNVEID